jgi:hypothetical protein
VCCNTYAEEMVAVVVGMEAVVVVNIRGGGGGSAD